MSLGVDGIQPDSCALLNISCFVKNGSNAQRRFCLHKTADTSVKSKIAAVNRKWTDA